MKQKTTLLKMVLTAVMMLGGASSAWAGDVTTLYERTVSGTASTAASDISAAWSTNDIYDSGVAATVGGWTPAKAYTGVTTSIDVGLKFVGNNGSNKSVQFEYSKAISVSESTSILHLTADIDYSKARAGSDGTLYSYLKIGDVEIRYCGKNYTFYVVCNGTTASTYNNGYDKSDAYMNVDVTINQATHTVNYTLKVYKNTSDANPLEITNTGTTGNSVTYNLSTGISQAGASNSTTHIIKNIKLTEESQSTRKITLSYQKSGSELKTAERDAVVGETYVVSDIDKVPFKISTNKYYYVSDNASSLGIISADGDQPTVVVTCRDAETWNWTLKGMCGVIDLGEITSGTVTEGEEVSTYYKNMLLKGNTLYSKSAGSGPSYKTQFTPTSDDFVQELTYEETVNKNVVFFSEAEDITGGTLGSNYLERNSGGKKAYFSSETNVTTLQPGTYQICYVLHGYDGSAVTVKYGTETALTETIKSSSATTYWSKNFTITTPTAITISGGNSTGCCDFIFILCSETKVTSVDNLGYTFSSTLPLDFSDTGVRAYIATYDSEKDVVRLTQKTKVPANTGVLIFSDSELTDQSIPVTSEITDDVYGNKLVAVSEAMTLGAAEGDVENYVLAIENDKAVFQLVKTTPASMSAGQAYLQIPKRSSEARSLPIVFDDESAGINDVRGKTSDVRGVYFNLRGQRVENPNKGLYIVNGNKVIIK